jgi:hypothetical protein
VYGQRRAATGVAGKRGRERRLRAAELAGVTVIDFRVCKRGFVHDRP